MTVYVLESGTCVEDTTIDGVFFTREEAKSAAEADNGTPLEWEEWEEGKVSYLASRGATGKGLGYALRTFEVGAFRGAVGV